MALRGTLGGTSGALWVALWGHFGWHFRGTLGGTLGALWVALQGHFGWHFGGTLDGTSEALWVSYQGLFGWHFRGTLGGALGEVDSEMPTMAPFCSSLLEQTHRNYQVYVVITPEIMILGTFIIP